MKMTVKQILKKAKITQHDLADILNVSQSAISQRVKNGLSVSMEEAVVISKFTELTPRQIRPDMPE